MPTISYDTQAVLAGDKVRFQGQEVAFVIATDPYSAQDALSLIDVEYEPLPAVVNARKALDPDAPLIRDDKSGQRDNLASPTWEAGDQGRPTARSPRPTPSSAATSSTRCHPAPLETCGIIADFNPRAGQLDIGSGQAPHHRTVSRVAEARPSTRSGSAAPRTSAAASATRFRSTRATCRDRRLDRGRGAGQVGGEPLENLMSTGFARGYVMRAEMCAKDGRITGLRVDVIADRAFDSTAQPTKFPAGVLPHRAALRPAGVAREGGHLHEQGSRRGGLPVLVPDHRGRLPGGAHGGRRSRWR